LSGCAEGLVLPPPVPLCGWGGSDEKIHLGTLQPLGVHFEHHRDRSAERPLRQAGEERRVLLFVPAHRKFIGYAEDQAIVLERNRFGGLDPGFEIFFGDFAAGVVQDTRPGFLQRQLHARRWLFLFGGMLLGLAILRCGCGKVNLDHHCITSLRFPAH
jgi:hypothetical protein